MIYDNCNACSIYPHRDILAYDDDSGKSCMLGGGFCFGLEPCNVVLNHALCAEPCINTLWPRQNGRNCPDDIFKRIFLNENLLISTKISLKFVARGSSYQ